MIIFALVFTILTILFFTGITEEQEEEQTEKIDVFIYDNLGLSPTKYKISSEKQIYSKIELNEKNRAQAILTQNKANPELAKLFATDIADGFEKKATAYTIIGGGVNQKTLVEIRLQPKTDAQKIKIVEILPKTTANASDIILTKGGGIISEQAIIFTFQNVAAGIPIKAVYVINKEITTLDSITITAEETTQNMQNTQRVCGDGKCVAGESHLSCCQDCGCLPGFVCEKNFCVSLEKDECKTDMNCDDADTSTKDTCTGRPKKCQNIQITECSNDDNYCPEGCKTETDNDCQTTITNTTTQITQQTTQEPEITGKQQSPIIEDIAITPEEAIIGDTLFVEAIVYDPNGKTDIQRVWFEILELAQSHGEIADMNDKGIHPDPDPEDDIYTGSTQISEYYLSGYYHVTVFAQDFSGNKKKMQKTFRVIDSN